MDAEKKELLKALLKFGGSICTSFTIDKLIKSNVNVDSIMGRIGISVGSALIGCVVCDRVEAHISKEFDEIDKTITQFKKSMNKEKVNGRA